MNPKRRTEGDGTVRSAWLGGNRKCAKLLWNGSWWLRYPGPDDAIRRVRMKADNWHDAFDEANRHLCHDSTVEWIIA